MSLTQHIVVGIVCRSYLQTTGTKLDINITVLNYRDDTVYQRYNYLTSLQPLVLGVLRVDTHGGITHDGLRTCSSNYSIVALLVLVDDIALGLQSLLVIEGGQTIHVIFQMEQMALFLFIDNLLG